MTLTDALPLLAGLALGAILGRLVDKSGFSIDRAFRRVAADRDREWRRAWWLAMALLWLAAGAVSVTPLRDAMRPIPAGPLAAVLAGLLAGAAMAVLAGDVVSSGYGTGLTSLPAALAFVAWAAGLMVASHGAMARLTGWVRSAGSAGLAEARLPGLGGAVAALAGEHLRPVGEAAAGFLVPLVAGILVLTRMGGDPVRVAPGRMEWPKQGAGLAIIVVLGWALALWGGETTGVNAVTAAETVREAAVGGRLWLHPSILVTAGVMGYAFLKALRLRAIFPHVITSVRGAVTTAAAGFVLGIASALAGGDPSAHAFFGLSTLSVGSVVFMISVWIGTRLAGRFDRRRGMRPAGGGS